MRSEPELYCRVCGYLPQDLPWGTSGNDPSWDICPCCRVGHGYEDSTPSSSRRFRDLWLAAGAPLFKPRLVNDGLSVLERLARVPEEYR